MSASQLCGNRQLDQDFPSRVPRQSPAAATPSAPTEAPPKHPLAAVSTRARTGGAESVAEAALRLAFPDLRPAALQHLFGRFGA